MRTNRRRFVTQSLLALGGISALPSTARAALHQAVARAGRPSGDWGAWVGALREQIPASTHSRYLQTAGVGPSPEIVIEKIASELSFQNQSPADPEISAAMSAVEPRLRDHLANREALVGERSTGLPDPRLEAGKIQRLAVPRVAGVVIDCVLGCQIRIGCLYLPSAPHLLDEPGHDVFSGRHAASLRRPAKGRLAAMSQETRPGRNPGTAGFASAGRPCL